MAPAAESPHDGDDGGRALLSSPEGAARDSITVSTWTAISRLTGMLRVLLIAAVLGPTYLGNAYQLTNALPNLVFYGFLGGSLFASLLVPSLVDHVDRGDHRDIERVTGGFLGIALLGLGVLAPIALVAVPLILTLMTSYSDSAGAADQVSLARWLLLMTIPQVAGYAVAGISAAVMNSQRRFALAAAAPSVENLVLIAVLIAVGVAYRSTPTDPPTGELLLLGLGSTGAVAMHAGLQWWGARRCGVALRPRRGWNDPEVRAIVRRAIAPLVQSALLALQILALLVVASTVAGGTVAFQIALNFYSLPISLVATPVALSLLPRLSRLVEPRDAADFADTAVRGIRLMLFLTLPAATGYLVLATPIASVVAGGEMATADGRRLIAVSLVSVACGLVGQALFFVTAQAAYARRDTGTPLRSMAVQCGVCLIGCAVALTADGSSVLVILGASYTLANLSGAGHLLASMRERLRVGTERWSAAMLQILVGCAVMGVLTLSTTLTIAHAADGRTQAVLQLASGCVVGLGAYGLTQRLLHSSEGAWLAASLRIRWPGTSEAGTLGS